MKSQPQVLGIVDVPTNTEEVTQAVHSSSLRKNKQMEESTSIRNNLKLT
jgi:hypothetical protein